MRLIGVSGYARAGKDSVGDILVEQGYQRVSFAKVMKDMALAINPIVSWDIRPNNAKAVYMQEVVSLNGWDEAKRRYPEVRRFLQRIGTEGGRQILGPALGLGDNLWVHALIQSLDPAGSYVVTDARFENEAIAIKLAGGALWRVTRPGIEAVNAHVSEKSLDNWNFDVRISNDGSLSDLSVSVLAFLDMGGREWTDPHGNVQPGPPLPTVDNDGIVKTRRT